MISATYTVQDLATPKIRAMLEQLGPRQRQAMLKRLGTELTNRLRSHFLARESEGNKQGFPSQHFWSREVRDNTALREVTADVATVGIASRPFRQKLRGGQILPGPGRKALAIPCDPASYGTRPSAGLIDGLFLLKAKGGKAYLARREGAGMKQVHVYFRLVASVNQEPDPRALPPVADLQAALEARADTELARITAPLRGEGGE